MLILQKRLFDDDDDDDDVGGDLSAACFFVPRHKRSLTFSYKVLKKFWLLLHSLLYLILIPIAMAASFTR